jgi:Dyp-type peroxidase family
LASDDEAKLRTGVAEALTAMDGFAKPIHIEWGITLRDSNERAIEHFGFADGISQPAIFNDSAAQVLPRHLLVPDMLARSNNAFGSYLVFRKLEQHVKEFELAVEQLAKSAEVSVEYAGAMVLGRFKDGTPLTHSILPKGQRVQDPDLLGHDDIRGTNCPFHAHIRKVNPRVNSQGRPVSLPLVRRGVPYGSYCRGAVRSEPVGLLFMAFQADLGRQFGIITAEWVNSPKFPEETTGTDALIGTAQTGSQRWPGARGGGRDADFAISRFVSLKGGEFFFAPSLSFFRGLN